MLVLTLMVLAGCPSTTHTITTGFVYGDETMNAATAKDPASVHGFQGGGPVGVSFGDEGLTKAELCGVSGFYWGGAFTPERRGRSVHTIPFSVCSTVELQ